MVTFVRWLLEIACIVVGAILLFMGLTADPIVMWQVILGIILLAVGGFLVIIHIKNSDGDGGGTDWSLPDLF